METIDFSKEKIQEALASSDPLVENYLAEGRDISYKERKSFKSSDFLDPERRSFPIKNCEDVKAAVHAWGRYKGSMTFEQFKAKLTRKAHELGCSLPDSWTKK